MTDNIENWQDFDEINNNQIIEDEDTSSGQDKVIIYPFNPNDIDIETPPFTIGYLVDMMAHDEINMNPDFQREGNLWSEEKQSRLIESILLGLPLPAFYFDTMNVRWDIIDGLQRCCSIKNFCVDKTLRLKGLEFLAERNGKKYLEGKSFDELDRTLQRSIITRPITVNKIKKADKNIRYILFKRLNTGGLELTPQEIRNAVYQGTPADTVKSMAKFEEFKQATCYGIPTKRMQDCDFVSRFVAFYLQGYENYQPSLDDFINKGMEKLGLIREQAICELEKQFKSSLKLSYKVFGKRAFRKQQNSEERRRPLNKAYFEVITVSFATLPEEKKQSVDTWKDVLLKNSYVLMRSERYSTALSGGTGTRDSVNIRFGWFSKVLEKSINGIRIRISDDNRIEDI